MRRRARVTYARKGAHHSALLVAFALLLGGPCLPQVGAFGASAVRAQGIPVRGLVYDMDMGAPLAGATVTLLDSLHRVVRGVEARSDGTFELAAGAGGWLLALAEGFLASAPQPVDRVSLQGGALEMVVGLVRLDTSRDAAPNGEPGVIAGEVTSDDGTLLAGAEVAVDGALRATTDARGFFRIDGVAVGEHLVSFSHLGFAPRERTVGIRPERGVFLTVVMAPQPIELDSIVATAVSRRTLVRVDEIQHRLRLGLGAFVRREELARRGHPSMEQVMRGLPGVNFVRGTPVFRLAFSIGNGWCAPTFFVDGSKISDYRSVLYMPTHDIQLIEVYKGAASVPAEYTGSDGRCGAIVIWTARGAEVPIARLLGG